MKIRQQTVRKRRKSAATVAPVPVSMGPARSQLIDFKPSAESEKRKEEEKEREIALKTLRDEQAEEEAKAKAEEDARLSQHREELNTLLPQAEPQPQTPQESVKNEFRLNANNFRSLWAVVDTAGSFQCKLKSAPSSSTFTEHMKRQVCDFRQALITKGDVTVPLFHLGFSCCIRNGSVNWRN